MRAGHTEKTQVKAGWRTGYLACRRGLGGRGSSAGRRRRQLGSAGRGGRGGSSGEACDPGPVGAQRDTQELKNMTLDEPHLKQSCDLLKDPPHSALQRRLHHHIHCGWQFKAAGIFLDICFLLVIRNKKRCLSLVCRC